MNINTLCFVTFVYLIVYGAMMCTLMSNLRSLQNQIKDLRQYVYSQDEQWLMVLELIDKQLADRARAALYKHKSA